MCCCTPGCTRPETVLARDPLPCPWVVVRRNPVAGAVAAVVPLVGCPLLLVG
jgi:hypothetical protein